MTPLAFIWLASGLASYALWLRNLRGVPGLVVTARPLVGGGVMFVLAGPILLALQVLAAVADRLHGR